MFFAGEGEAGGLILIMLFPLAKAESILQVMLDFRGGGGWAAILNTRMAMGEVVL